MITLLFVFSDPKMEYVDMPSADLLKLEDKNDPKAWNEIGFRYDIGKMGFEVDKAKAYEYYMKAAETGYDIAQYNVGCMYNWGSVPGQDRNKVEAIKWYTLAAEQGEMDSQYLLAQIYEDHVDMEQAMKWYVKAATQNHPQAVYRLQSILVNNYRTGYDYIILKEAQIVSLDNNLNKLEVQLENLYRTNERMKIYINELECLPPDDGGVMYQYHKNNFYQT